MKRKPRIYVAGPLTTGNLSGNVRRAIDVGNILFEMGYVPFIPHLDHFWNMMHPHDYEDWMEWDFSWLDCCDVLYRIPGESAGSDREVERSMQYGRDTLVTFEQAETWLENWYNTV